MARSGEHHGGKGKVAAQVEKMQDVYVEKRMEGMKGRDAARVAGYAENTEVRYIERTGGPVATKLEQALAAKGLDDDFLAGEYRTGIKESKTSGARDKDLNAHAQYLKQLGWLLGHGKQSPSVAVQINATGQRIPEDADPRAIGDTLREVAALLKDIKAELGNRGHIPVCEGSNESEDAAVLARLVQTDKEPPEASGGGGT